MINILITGLTSIVISITSAASNIAIIKIEKNIENTEIETSISNNEKDIEEPLPPQIKIIERVQIVEKIVEPKQVAPLAAEPVDPKPDDGFVHPGGTYPEWFKLEDFERMCTYAKYQSTPEDAEYWCIFHSKER